LFIRNKRLIIILVLITALAAGGFWFYNTYYAMNPHLEQALREQFGDQFFDDFEEVSETEADANENNADELEDVIEKYEPLFENLEKTAMNRLEELFQSAIEEYEEQRQARTLDRFQLTNKYINAGRLLEQRVDRSFYMLLEQMESELERKDLPTDIIPEIEKTYKEAKDEKKQELFGRLREEVSN